MVPNRIRHLAALLLLAAVLVDLALTPTGAQAGSTSGSYTQTNLVSDLPGAKFQDPNLVNAWGLSHTPAGPWWVADNGTGLSTIYQGDGTPSSLVVTIPAAGGGAGGTPTGNVYNPFGGSNPTDFVVSSNGRSGPSTFIFATEDGTISGYKYSVDTTHAIMEVDRSGVGSGAVYKGLAIGSANGNNLIYATNFRFGTVEVFSGQWQLLGSFTDKQLTTNCPLPNQCFAPFGIQNVKGKLVVTFALQDPTHHDDVPGPGNGYVDVFDLTGHLLNRAVSQGPLNSPWGVALAPSDFGMFSNAVLVGNFGDGRINAFSLKGTFLGPLTDSNGYPIWIDGLWGLQFGNGGQAGKTNELFFSAGLNDEADGLFGKINATQ